MIRRQLLSGASIDNEWWFDKSVEIYIWRSLRDTAQ